ncbi:MAG: signal peptidase II [Acidimicrobiia bacterium]|nr:signal peptidase II [Acidimicrobiia bacterium]
MPSRGRPSGSSTRPVASDDAESAGSGRLRNTRLQKARLRNNRLRLASIAATVLLADQLTKLWALRTLEGGDIHLFWTIRLRLVFNQGTAFGLGSSFAPVITVAAVIVSVLLLALTWSTTRSRTAALAGLVLGGALGNLGDRAFRGDGFFGGSVIDFVDPQWWPVFNLADAAISVGVVLFLVLGTRAGLRGDPLLERA